MKTKIIINSFTALSILFLVTLFGCKDEIVTPITGSVNGTFTLVDPEGKSVGVPGVKVYLIDSDFKPDTVDISNNNKAILDSTVSDENGMYKFVNLKEGNYGVAPVPENSNYSFTLNNSADSYSFSINDKKNSFTVNYQVYDLSSTLEQEPFTIKIVGKNFPAMNDGWWFIYSIHRIQYLLFVPLNLYLESKCEAGFATDLSKPFIYSYEYGYTTIIYTCSNKFAFTFSEVRLNDAGTENIYRNRFYFDYDLTLSSCPSSSTFEYDWTAHTFTRIE